MRTLCKSFESPLHDLLEDYNDLAGVEKGSRGVMYPVILGQSVSMKISFRSYTDRSLPQQLCQALTLQFVRTFFNLILVMLHCG